MKHSAKTGSVCACEQAWRATKYGCVMASVLSADMEEAAVLGVMALTFPCLHRSEQEGW